MSTLLGRAFPLKVDIWPPHMSPEDYAIFRRWAFNAFQGALKVFYDVGLGAGSEYPKDTPVELVRMWTKVTQKRADMVVEYPDSVRIIELRDNASSNAIGRLLQYKVLWLDDPVIPKPLRLTLVTNKPDAEIKRLCELYGIEFILA